MIRQMKFSVIFAIALFSSPGLLLAAEHVYIQSVPQTIPQDQIHRVNVQRVNGKNPITSHRYTVDAGEATIRVSLILEAQWAPKLKAIQDDIFSLEFKMNIKAGTTYVIGGKVNPDASVEEQKAGTFWTPTVVEERN